MTSTTRTVVRRQVFLHDPTAPAATVVAPSVHVATFDRGDRLLLVRRCDSGGWELPGGRVDVGESAIDAGVREVLEEAGVHIRITGLVGLFTGPAHVIRDTNGEVRQPFEVVFRATAIRGDPHGDLRETSEAAWFAVGDLARTDIEPAARVWIGHVIGASGAPHLG